MDTLMKRINCDHIGLVIHTFRSKIREYRSLSKIIAENPVSYQNNTVRLAKETRLLGKTKGLEYRLLSKRNPVTYRSNFRAPLAALGIFDNNGSGNSTLTLIYF